MFVDPDTLAHDLDRLEGIEKGTIRLVSQALYEFRETAQDIFRTERDLPGDIGEDITREALDRLGVSKIDVRLFGKVDYKRARYVFNRDYAVRQALFIDSKAEKISGQRTLTIQMAQTSMCIRQIRQGKPVEMVGSLPAVINSETGIGKLLTTTVFVKYNYEALPDENRLFNIVAAVIPNGMLQDRYNPSAHDTIWLVGRNAPSRGERFRVRLAFNRLKRKANWRVQTIPMPPQPLQWAD